MRLAWFRAATLEDAGPLDRTAALIAALEPTHEIAVFSHGTAHDFVWTHGRTPFGLCVFELDNDAAHAFVWPYLIQYGGLLLLHTPTLHDSRVATLALERRRDDYTAEFAFNEGQPPAQAHVLPWPRPGDWPMLRVPLMAARLTVVPSAGVADALRAEYPQARILSAPLGVPEAPPRPARPRGAGAPVVFGMLAADRVDAARRALARARAAGAPADLLVDGSPGRLLQDADVILALSWPWDHEPHQLARAAMAAGTPVLTVETVRTADWPALDPQTWQPRGVTPQVPVAVTVDLRDEEHSLVVAMRRLAADAALRGALGRAGRDWWRAHASAGAAADAWRPILAEAARLDPPARPAGWPPHLDADGTGRARAMLAEFGVTVDLF